MGASQVDQIKKANPNARLVQSLVVKPKAGTLTGTTKTTADNPKAPNSMANFKFPEETYLNKSALSGYDQQQSELAKLQKNQQNEYASLVAMLQQQSAQAAQSGLEFQKARQGIQQNYNKEIEAMRKKLNEMYGIQVQSDQQLATLTQDANAQMSALDDQSGGTSDNKMRLVNLLTQSFRTPLIRGAY